MNVTLFGKRLFADVMVKNFGMRQSSCIISVGPKSNDKYLYKRKGQIYLRKTQRRRGWKDTGRDWSNVATSWRTPSNTNSH